LPGEKDVFTLELKVLADVGLVGLPNAGKSTLLSRVSAATPKIADYPFTTLQPNLGIVKYGEFQSFVMADIPGLIEGASEGKGLGHQFLRHIERTNVLLFLIDVLEENPREVYDTLRNEIYNYNKDLKQKRFFVIRTKIDLLQSSKKELESWSDFAEPYINISSVSGSGIPQLVKAIVETINES
jgi:GTP-binding protein